MVLTRAQRAQSNAGSVEVSEPLQVTKTKTTTKTPKTAAVKTKKPIEAKDEDKPSKKTSRATSTTASSLAKSKDNVPEEPKPVKTASRATSTTATTSAKSKSKSKSTKSETKEVEKTTKTASGRPRKQAQFVEVQEKKKKEALEETSTTTKTSGRSRKPPVVTTTTTSAATSSTSTRGRPRKTPVSESTVASTKNETKDLKSSALGKPIRPKKRADAIKATDNAQNADAKKDMTQLSSLQRREPKLAPPIRASPMKMNRNTPMSTNIMAPIAFPALESSILSPSKSLGSPLRLPPRNNPFMGESPLRNTPGLPQKQLPSQSTTLNMPAQPIFSNPLRQSPIRPSAKKSNGFQVELAEPLGTPMRTIGTPMRRGLNSSALKMQFPQTAVPLKRSFMESPIRPKSAQGPKRMRMLSTPEKSCNTAYILPMFHAKNTPKMTSTKKTVSFQSPQAQDQEPSQTSDASSPSHKFHRISAVTEVTEPEESVEEVFSDNPTMEAMEAEYGLVEIKPMAMESQIEAIEVDTFESEAIEVETVDTKTTEAVLEIETSIEESAVEAHDIDISSLQDALYEQDAAKDVLMFDTDMEPVAETCDEEVLDFEHEMECALPELKSSMIQVSDSIEPSAANQEYVGEMTAIGPIDDTPEDSPSPTKPITCDVKIETVTQELEEVVQEQPASMTTPEPLTILSGMIFFVDVWTANGSNANQFFAPLLEELGAIVSTEWSAEITHVLFKDGTSETLQRVIDSEGAVRCLNVGWAVDCERQLARITEDKYEIDVYMAAGILQTPRTPLRELQSNSRAITPKPRSAKTPAKTPGKTPGTVKFNAALMAFHNAVQTPELASDGEIDVENMDSPLSHVTPLVQKTCPPKQMSQPLFTADGTSSAVKRRLFRSRRSLGDALTR